MPSESNVWIASDGVTQLSLNGTAVQGVLALEGRQGIFFPPVTIQEQYVPLQPGSIVRFVNYDPRDVLLPLLIKAADEIGFTALLRQLATFFDTPATFPGTYRRVAADGSSRDLYCYYKDGLEVDETISNGVRGAGWAKVVVNLYANDPFWYDSNYTVQTFVPSGAAPTFLPALIPIKLGSAGISSGFSVTNSGDYEAWPIWTIHGPGVNPVLTNTTTGKAVTLTVTLGSSDVLIIDTRPLIKVVFLNNVINWSIYNPTSALWSLIKGVNACTLNMTGTGANSQIQLAYKQRYKVA